MGEYKEKWMQYAVLIRCQISEMFKDECENHISLEELQEEDNIKHFIHALATVVPTMVYNKFTETESNTLEFNHIANHLVFEFTTKED